MQNNEVQYIQHHLLSEGSDNVIGEINQVLEQLPAFQQVEILDFAKYLASKAPIPTTTVTFDSFAGTLSGSDNFNGDPVETQKAMRDEWN